MIHDENPFIDSPDRRDPVRRFRGRLTAPVTIVTAGAGTSRSGLTVSSLMVIEGDPGRVHLVVGPTSDLWSSIGETGRFVIHICRANDRHLAEVFAGLRPSPGGPFAGLAVDESEHGPVIGELAERAYCSLENRAEQGWSGVVEGVIDRVESADLSGPLVYFRGGYRALD
jgi:3-hydroxy-9,10-secoandrosta-1,3,5(10)-triene-9,17-dione monooxygenase reductase component